MSLNNNLNGLNPLSYMGVNAPAPVNLTVRNNDPTTTDAKNFERGALWLNPNNNRMFQLISLVGGVATWEGITYFVTRDVNPTSDDATYALGTLWLNTATQDVFMLIATTGTPPTSATWVLLMDASGPLLEITTQDAVVVQPVSGNVNIYGTGNIATTGAGDTATIALVGTTNQTLQVGNASGSLTSLAAATNGQIPIGSTGANPVIATITAGTGMSVTNGAGSITLAVTGTGVVQTLTGNSGGAISPTAGNINTVGSGNISIAGSGSTLTTTLVGTTDHAIQLGNASGSLTSLGVATNGQLPIGSTGADPVLATLTAGTGISVTNGAGTITLDNTGVITVNGDSGSATGNTITIAGGTNVTTSASGSTVTINASGGSGGASTPWTPSVEFNGDSTGVTYTTLSGNYVQNGDTVNFYCLIALSSRGGNMGTEKVTITGLPLGAITGQSYQGLCSIAEGDSTIPIPYVYNDGMTTTIYLLDSVLVSSAGAPLTASYSIIASDITDTSIFQITGSYITT